MPPSDSSSSSRQDQRGALPQRRERVETTPAAEKSNYTMEEMMARLKQGSGGGTGRRRRRSHQPVYSQRRRKRWVVVLLAGLAAAIVAAWLGIRFLNRIRIEGESFRQALNRRLTDLTGATIELLRVRPGGADSLAATEAVFTTPQAMVIESGVFNDISASLTAASWVQDEWGIPDLAIGRGTVHLNPQRASGTAGIKAEQPPAAPARDSRFFGSITSEPSSISLDGGRVSSFNLTWPGPNGYEEGLRDVYAGFKLTRSGVLELNLQNNRDRGTLDLAGLPPRLVRRAHLVLNGHSLTINGRAELAQGHEIEAAGKADLTPEGAVELDLTTENSPLRFLVPAEWQNRVSGLFTMKKAAWRSELGGSKERQLKGTFEIRGAVLRDLAFTDKISTALNRPELVIMEFESLTGKVLWTPAKTMIYDLDGVQGAVLRLRGHVTVAATGEVGGHLVFEAGEAVMATLPGGALADFGPLSDGWAPLEVKISGTAVRVADDIRLRQAGDGPPANPELRGQPRLSPPAAPPRQPTPHEAEKLYNEFIQQ